jgi:hypothetical protein
MPFKLRLMPWLSSYASRWLEDTNRNYIVSGEIFSVDISFEPTARLESEAKKIEVNQSLDSFSSCFSVPSNYYAIFNSDPQSIAISSARIVFPSVLRLGFQ